MFGAADAPFTLPQDSRSGEGVLAYYGSKEACEREVERGETTAKGVIMFSKMAAIREEHEALEATRVLAVATLVRCTSDFSFSSSAR